VSRRWWTAAVLLAIVAATLTLVGPAPWLNDWPAWATALLNGASVLIWVWLLEAVVLGVRRLIRVRS
jgi:hypothetical protein